MTPISATRSPASRGLLLAIAKRYVWWLPPDEVLTGHISLLLRQVLSLATAEDYALVETAFGRATLIAALGKVPPGSIDPKSWSFWRLRYGLEQRPVPRRTAS